jgi:hypothetical protein
VAAGLTLCVPPDPGSVYELPSEPVRITFVALDALTDNVEAAPAATVAGLAEMLTVGAALVTLPLTPPQPTSSAAIASPRNSVEINRRNLRNPSDTGRAFLVLDALTRKEQWYCLSQAQLSSRTNAGMLKKVDETDMALDRSQTQGPGAGAVEKGKLMQLGFKVRLPKSPFRCLHSFHSPMRKIPVTTGLSLLPVAEAKALIVRAVPLTMIGAL